VPFESDIMGTIGYELFKRYIVELDYQARTLTLREPAEFRYVGSGARLPITLVRNIPTTTVTLVTRKSGNLSAQLQLDLGSSTYAIRLSRRFLYEHPIESDTATVRAPLGAGVGGVEMGRLARMPAVLLGPLRVERPSVMMSQERDGALGEDASSDGTIGVAIFRRTRAVFDYSRSEVILDPRGGLDVPDSLDASGLFLTKRSGGFQVYFVTEGSPANEENIRVGDDVLAIDGVSTASMTTDRAHELLSQAGSVCRITIRRSAQERVVHLVLKPIA
jgi:hypothetical protein